MFWLDSVYQDGLCQSDQPALHCDNDEQGIQMYALSPAGEELLNHRLNWLDLSPKERWVGGVAIKPEGQNWCWNPHKNTPEYK